MCKLHIKSVVLKDSLIQNQGMYLLRQGLVAGRTGCYVRHQLDQMSYNVESFSVWCCPLYHNILYTVCMHVC